MRTFGYGFIENAKKQGAMAFEKVQEGSIY